MVAGAHLQRQRHQVLRAVRRAAAAGRGGLDRAVALGAAIPVADQPLHPLQQSGFIVGRRRRHASLGDCADFVSLWKLFRIWGNHELHVETSPKSGSSRSSSPQPQPHPSPCWPNSGRILSDSPRCHRIPSEFSRNRANTETGLAKICPDPGRRNQAKDGRNRPELVEPGPKTDKHNPSSADAAQNRSHRCQSCPNKSGRSQQWPDVSRESAVSQVSAQVWVPIRLPDLPLRRLIKMESASKRRVCSKGHNCSANWRRDNPSGERGRNPRHGAGAQRPKSGIGQARRELSVSQELAKDTRTSFETGGIRAKIGKFRTKMPKSPQNWPNLSKLGQSKCRSGQFRQNWPIPRQNSPEPPAIGQRCPLKWPHPPESTEFGPSVQGLQKLCPRAPTQI